MNPRGKFHALSMINWNGFFARTFELDELVTTLSGGNGAGKSTTMAALITALIPDQSLLHFRNTTEAGSSSASRDKGLHGKLKPGSCYSAIRVINSRQQHLLFGVHLQQIAGRDKKVEIKTFVIQNLPVTLDPSEILLERTSATQVRVRQLSQVKEAAARYDDVQFKTFSSVSDYHSFMFEQGVLPKKLRNQADRSKFYRLIEASLYGGISSAITKSLRDYLLPQNSGVKKAFQDMEMALKENRMTLEAIRITQQDRDLFKQLITQATQYVAADFMRHANERRSKVKEVLSLRGEQHSAQTVVENLQCQFEQFTDENSTLSSDHLHAEAIYQAACDHLQIVQTAVRQQEKIDRYQDDLQELVGRLEEQTFVFEESHQALQETEEHTQLSEEEVDSLKSQLADYQQALNTQQTRALQYQQAIQARDKARELLQNDVDEHSAKAQLDALNTVVDTKTNTLLQLKHRLDLSRSASKQFERGFAFVQSIAPHTPREQAYTQAQQLIQQGLQYQQQVKNSGDLHGQHRYLERQLQQFSQAKQLTAQYQQQFKTSIATVLDVHAEQEKQTLLFEEAQLQLQSQHETVSEQRRGLQQLTEKINQLESISPAWSTAQHALELLSEQSQLSLTDQQSVIDAMQETAENTRVTLSLRDKLAAQKNQLEKEINQLAQPGGNEDPKLQALADTLGGTLLSEIYDEIALSDAPYFSALYGPARHAIVVPDLKAAQDNLLTLDDCPDDLYLIEGDADSFDESVFNVTELENAVCVKISDRQLRYSRFPKVAIFGRAAREHRLVALREQREAVQESYAQAAFDVQRLQRLTQRFNHFFSHHLQTAFVEDPELQLKKLRDQQTQLTRESRQQQEQHAQAASQIERCKSALQLLGKLEHLIEVLEDTELEHKQAQLAARMQELEQAKQFLQQHQTALTELELVLPSLDADPELFAGIEQEYQQADTQMQQFKHQQFALNELTQRAHHFTYHDAQTILAQSSQLDQQLNAKLVVAEKARDQGREQLKTLRARHNQDQQQLAALKSTYQAKQETLQEFLREFNELKIHVDNDTLSEANEKKSRLYQDLTVLRERSKTLEKALATTEIELKTAIKQLKKGRKEYLDLRKFVVQSKAGWVDVLSIAKQNGVAKQLTRREMTYLSSNELRSLSDKSLGTLRQVVADHETLRDALRASEDLAKPECKVLFYVAVYQHLRERIRQDIIRTDDPIEAIEEMEVELARLTEELTSREKKLAISSDSVANIIRKTIQREQNRIRQLNQGLSNILFGQVKGVRLTTQIRETHASLLLGLCEQAEQHQDLFGDQRLSFSQAMAKLFQRLNPHIELGQRSAQTFGEELLDYRNYLELGIEVNRGTDGWLQAESGALSTGEAIGTGQAILLMVVQSWEDESRRLRASDLVPCRLLFLDEAARLDSKSITTLFELCDRLDMQLLIAAPENISPEQGTTYKLVRKILNDKEHVHVVGLRGFASHQRQPVTPEFASPE